MDKKITGTPAMDSHEFIVTTNREHEEWFRAMFVPECEIDLKSLWAWQEQERRKRAEPAVLSLPPAEDLVKEAWTAIREARKWLTTELPEAKTNAAVALRAVRDDYGRLYPASSSRAEVERDAAKCVCGEPSETCEALASAHSSAVHLSDRYVRANRALKVMEENLALANKTARSVLSERDSMIRELRKRYSAIEISEMVGITRQRVHQILKEALAAPAAPEEKP